MQTILFDVDGVLIHGYHARENLRHFWDENLEHDLGIGRQIFKEKFIHGDFIDKVFTGKLSLYEALEKFLPIAGFWDDPQIVIDYCLKNDSKVNEELIQKIKIIKQSPEVALYIATNQEHNRARYLMEILGFQNHFMDIFHSAKIGFIKPDRKYFEKVHSLLGTPAVRPIFFDDTPKVVEAANDFGWKAYEFLSVNDLYRDACVKSILMCERFE